VYKHIYIDSDVFVIWATCKWDGKIRGFLLEKVGFGGLFCASN
jgi:hypothetical protein